MKRLITYLLPVLFFLTGCSIDEGDNPVGEDGAKGGMTFVVNLPDPNRAPGSYALSDEDENAVNTIDVFAFQRNGGVYKLVEHAEVDAGTITSDSQNNRKKSFRVNFRKLKENEYYQYVILANAKGMVSPTAGMERDALMALFKIEGITRWVDATIDIPMWGESKEMLLTNNMKIEGLSLLRMVAKINVELHENVHVDFKLKSVRLYNYRSCGYVVPDRDNLETGSTTNVAAPTVLGSKVLYPLTPVIYTFSGGDMTEKECTNQIYTFETDMPRLQSRSLDFNKMHALVIGGSYKGNKETFYRVNFSKTEEDQTIYLDLLRNHRYTINISSVSGNGYESPEEAFESKGLNMESTVIDWNDGEMTEIVFDGQYLLTVSKGIWNFNDEKQDESSTENILKIFTDYPDGWKIVKTVDGADIDIEWLKLSSIKGDGNQTTTCQLLLDSITDNTSRTGYIFIQAGRLTYKITVNQYIINVKLNKDKLDLKVGESEMLIANVTPEDGINKNVKWHSANPDVAIVDDNGNVTAVSVGEAIIIVTTEEGGKTDECIVSVSKVPVASYKTKRILTIGANVLIERYGYMLEDNSASRAFVDASVNFGSEPNSTVKMDVNGSGNAFTIEIITHGAGMSPGEHIDYNYLKDKLNMFKPDIILTGQAINYFTALPLFGTQVIDLLNQFVEEGGVFLMCNEYYPIATSTEAMVKKIMGIEVSGNDQTLASLIFKLNGNTDDPIINGPFGNMQGKNWGADGISMFGFTGLRADQVNIYSTRTDGYVNMFRHKTKPFFFMGEGGFISNYQKYIGDSYKASNTYCPFAIDENYRPIPRINYTSTMNQTVYNSQIFGNILAWAVAYSEEKGIKYPDSGNKFP